MRVPRSGLTAIVGAGVAALGCGEHPLGSAVAEPVDAGASSAASSTAAAGSLDAIASIGPVQLATVPPGQSLRDVSVDATGVYFAVGWYAQETDGVPGSDTQGAIRRVDRDGGETVELWRGQGIAYAVGAGTSAIYFITYEYASRGRAGYLRSVPRSGGPSGELGSWWSQGSTIAIAVDGDVVYWGHSAGSSGALNRSNPIDGTTVSLVPEVSPPFGLATDGKSVFYVTGDGLFGVPVTGGLPVSLWGHSGRDGSLAVAPGSPTLLACADGSSIVGIDLSSDQVQAVTGTPCGDVTVDHDFVYWIDGGSGRILKTPVAGGTPTVLASGLSRPVAIAADELFVYWVDQDAHAVMRAPKR